MTPRLKVADDASADDPSSNMAVPSGGKEMVPLKYLSYEQRWSEENIQLVLRQWQLTKQEEQQLRELQRRLRDVDHWKNNPPDVIRYLRGPGHFEQVEGKIREMIEWRKSYGADNLLKEYTPPRSLLYYVPSGILKGYDKDGDPIYLERGGAMDGVGLQRYSREDIVKHVIWLREIATTVYPEDYERAQGKPPKQVTIIYDLHGLDSSCLKHGVIPMFKAIVQVNQQRYCGLAKRIILLRAPSVFNFLWNIAKHFFPPEAVKLMVFTGPNNYMKVLDRYIDREVLPSCICKEGRGGAIEYMPQNFEGGKIPPHAEASIPDVPWIANLLNTPKIARKREEEIESRRNLAQAQKRHSMELHTAPPVCLSEIMNVKVFHVPQPRWDEEFETVLVQ